jgi:hypothetical protein
VVVIQDLFRRPANVMPSTLSAPHRRAILSVAADHRSAALALGPSRFGDVLPGVGKSLQDVRARRDLFPEAAGCRTTSRLDFGRCERRVVFGDDPPSAVG